MILIIVILHLERDNHLLNSVEIKIRSLGRYRYSQCSWIEIESKNGSALASANILNNAKGICNPLGRAPILHAIRWHSLPSVAGHCSAHFSPTFAILLFCTAPACPQTPLRPLEASPLAALLALVEVVKILKHRNIYCRC